MKSIKNENRYLERLSAPLQEKMIIARYVPPKTRSILDVGCADGTVTMHLAQLFPEANVIGIDLNKNFVDRAEAKVREDGVKNIRFERIYLRDLLAREDRYEIITFVSVLHEFFSRGEGISSVVKAIADAHELLVPGGRIIIRDMAAPEYFKKMRTVDALHKKIVSKEKAVPYFESFQKKYGPTDNLLALNHFLLKYPYMDNWEYEMEENYLGVTVEEYEQAFALLGMQTLHAKAYLIPFLREMWEREFGLSEKELDELVSTALLVGEKG
ncbi:class I SAM-dependent methyltransferase [Patescibacteria group bacterium]|nr:class I SAM-dependent methyltransferase [Patescibacteria group bacterium]